MSSCRRAGFLKWEQYLHDNIHGVHYYIGHVLYVNAQEGRLSHTTNPESILSPGQVDMQGSAQDGPSGGWVLLSDNKISLKSSDLVLLFIRCVIGCKSS